jgi:hypothetical protein
VYLSFVHVLLGLDLGSDPNNPDSHGSEEPNKIASHSKTLIGWIWNPDFGLA